MGLRKWLSIALEVAATVANLAWSGPGHRSHSSGRAMQVGVRMQSSLQLHLGRVSVLLTSGSPTLPSWFLLDLIERPKCSYAFLFFLGMLSFVVVFDQFFDAHLWTVGPHFPCRRVTVRWGECRTSHISPRPCTISSKV